MHCYPVDPVNPVKMLTGTSKNVTKQATPLARAGFSRTVGISELKKPSSVLAKWGAWR